MLKADRGLVNGFGGLRRAKIMADLQAVYEMLDRFFSAGIVEHSRAD